MDGEGEAGEDGDDDAKSPKKKKGASRSVSKGKKKKKSDEDTIDVIKQKESTKVKKKWILDEKIEIPPEILEWIEEHYPGERPPSTQEPSKEKEKEKPIPSGVDLMNVYEVKGLVEAKYYFVQKQKLKRFTEKNKAKTELTRLTRMLLHLSLNIGPQTKVNEDIEEHLKDGVANLMLQAQGTAGSEVSPLKEPKPDEPKELDATQPAETQNMSKTQDMKQADPAARSQKSGGSLHPSQ